MNYFFTHLCCTTDLIPKVHGEGFTSSPFFPHVHSLGWRESEMSVTLAMSLPGIPFDIIFVPFFLLTFYLSMYLFLNLWL